MMQTMGHLGLELAGEKFPQEVRVNRRLKQDGLDAESRAAILADLAKSKRMNPGGFYEVPGVVMRGTREIQDFGGKVLKLICPAAWSRESPRGFAGTPDHLVWKRILCLRHPKPVAYSQSQLRGDIQVVGEDEFSETPTCAWEDLEQEVSPMRYLRENGFLMDYLIDNGLTGSDRLLVVDYDDMVNQTEETIRRIAEFVGVRPTEGQFAKAVGNIDPTLRRSKLDEWPGQVRLQGAAAENLYEGIKTLNVAKVKSAVAETKDFIETGRQMNSWFYSREFVAMVSVEFLEQLRTIEGMREEQMANAAQRRASGWDPETHPTFEEPADAPEYTVEVPFHLGGNLVRRMVEYEGELLTWEDAYKAHVALMCDNGERPVDPARVSRKMRETYTEDFRRMVGV